AAWACTALDPAIRTLTAESPTAALALVRQALVDCVVVETAWAGDGFLAEAHALASGLPAVILAGGLAGGEPEARVLAAVVGTPGLTGYLARPWEAAPLRAAVARALVLADEHRASERELARLRRRLDAAQVVHDLAGAEGNSHREIIEVLATTLARL